MFFISLVLNRVTSTYHPVPHSFMASSSFRLHPLLTASIFFFVLFAALGSSRREEDQVLGGSAGGDSDEKAGDQAETL